jgi:hypothetical protein
MTSHRTITAALGLAAAFALALSAPVSARTVHLADQDLRSPDTHYGGSPTALTQQDLRSPDARDAATATRRPVSPASIVSVSADGFDWGDAAIGAGGAAGLVLVLAGAGTAVMRRRVAHSVTH